MVRKRESTKEHRIKSCKAARRASDRDKAKCDDNKLTVDSGSNVVNEWIKWFCIKEPCRMNGHEAKCERGGEREKSEKGMFKKAFMWAHSVVFSLFSCCCSRARLALCCFIHSHRKKIRDVYARLLCILIIYPLAATLFLMLWMNMSSRFPLLSLSLARLLSQMCLYRMLFF